MRVVTGLAIAATLMMQTVAALAAAAAPAIPPVFLSAADARAVVARRGERVIGGALTALDEDAQATLHRGVTPAQAYSGCDIRTYLPQFSYDYGGAADRAAGLANYAYLHSLDRSYGSDAAAKAAGEQAEALVVGWARDGFRKPDGSYRVHPSDFCDAAKPDADSPRGVVDAIGLQLGRGMPAYVHAVDLLERTGRLDPGERSDVLAFMRRMGGLIREGADARAADQKLDCNRYSNQTSVAVAAMVAIARATGNEAWRRGLMAGDPGAAAIGWPQQVDHAIYATTGPTLSCYHKPAGDSLWQPPVASPGEIADRYRQKPGQTFGYVTFSLFSMVKPLMIDTVAGGAPGAYAEQRRRIGLALDYYAHYLAAIGPGAATVDANAARFPGGEAYLGKVVSAAGCASEAGSDHLVFPYVGGIESAIPEGKGAALIARIAHDMRCPAPLSRLDPVLIGAYAHLGGG